MWTTQARCPHAHSHNNRRRSLSMLDLETSDHCRAHARKTRQTTHRFRRGGDLLICALICEICEICVSNACFLASSDARVARRYAPGTIRTVPTYPQIDGNRTGAFHRNQPDLRATILGVLVISRPCGRGQIDTQAFIDEEFCAAHRAAVVCA